MFTNKIEITIKLFYNELNFRFISI